MSAQRAPRAPEGTPEGVLRKYWGFNAFRSCQQVRGFGFQLYTLPDRRLTIPMHPTHLHGVAEVVLADPTTWCAAVAAPAPADLSSH